MKKISMLALLVATALPFAASAQTSDTGTAAGKPMADRSAPANDTASEVVAKKEHTGKSAVKGKKGKHHHHRKAAASTDATSATTTK